MKERLTTELLAAAGGLAFFKVIFLPDANLLAWVFISMLLDLITGVVKAVVLKQARTSSGYRKTVIKFTQYAGAIAVGIILANTMQKDSAIVGYVNSALLILLIYIEATSIFENLYAIDNSSPFSRYFIAPILKLLTLAIKKSPLNQAAGKEK
ncbi:phage holin family protein [Chitinophaga japonensis]|uniref:Holin family protein n=1 Tax=Chitinophaga japonensis TaxID=104662 RepID=A0A562SZV6_CHIJA|nr:phage holin family protein [Chitinophaga japonensis]TWI86290.1 holin family protein [Chitinophaga japonensis]